LKTQFFGVHTDSEGNYSLLVRNGGVYKLRFSFIGFESQIRDITLKGDTVLNIVLLAKSVMTEEVFVNATRAGEQTPMAYSTVYQRRYFKE